MRMNRFLDWLDTRVGPLPLFFYALAACLLALGFLMHFIARYV